ncbi:MAG TPA: hypothetical protein VEZ59_06410 [Sphingopyxis sp.]|nr:hypothetical protein [Sphingopyxis sp.]
MTTADAIAAALRPLAPGGALHDPDVPLINELAALWAARAPTASPPDAAAYPFPISAIDTSLLELVAPHLRREVLAPWVDPIRRACARFRIDTIRRIAAFITTLAHEGGFRVGRREDMNYSAVRLSQVWPTRFAAGGVKGKPNALAYQDERKPEALANYVYANRMGNGAPESGDGWRYRGNGPPQLTGAANHKAFAVDYGMPVEQAVEWIGTIEGGVAAAAWFWEENDINRLADTPGIKDETRAINGGETGLADRQHKFDTLVAELLRRERLA